LPRRALFAFLGLVKLSFRRLGLRLAHTWTIARTRAMRVADVVVLELFGPQGVTALGEAAPIGRYGESAATVEAFLRRVDPARLSFDAVQESMAYLETLSAGDMAAKCAVNVALLDGAAQLARRPLHDFLGLRFRESCHVTSFTIGIDTPDMIREKVIAAADYPVLKMKAGVATDEGNLRALRELAPTKPLRVDANEGWRDKEVALRAIERLADDPRIQFVEQPMPVATPRSDWSWLKRRAPLPIFADESYRLAADAEAVAESFHGVNVKLVKTGGIHRAMDALRAARGFGLKTMLGCMIETSILISAAAHLAELCDYLDLDGNLLIRNDPYAGVTAARGVVSFAKAPAAFGLQVRPR
jgi:L-alanine-DL-glutamate epimerase-like enolase superfamily enzyme